MSSSQNPLLSVLVITYNQEKYIRQTLNSIVNQEHHYSYEIVIGDDCSTDRTRNIIAEYEKKYPEIIKPLYNKKNLGLIGNYFNVINHCSGKYIMECAGDDWWLPGKIVKQIEYLNCHEDIGLCYGKAKCYDENGISLNYSIGAKIKSFDDLILENKIPAVSVCFQRVLFENYRNQINPQDKNWLMEDYPMWLWFSKESKIQFLDEDFAAYRLLSGSITHSKDLEKNVNFEYNCYEIKKFYSDYYNTKIKNYNRDYFWFKANLNQCFATLSDTNRQNIINKSKKYVSLNLKERIYLYLAHYKFLFWAFVKFRKKLL